MLTCCGILHGKFHFFFIILFIDHDYESSIIETNVYCLVFRYMS